MVVTMIKHKSLTPKEKKIMYDPFIIVLVVMTPQRVEVHDMIDRKK